MAFFRDLAALLRFSGFRRLFAVRLLSQGSDGIFQVALASAVLFSPERATTAGAIAVAFATILMPFTVLGPFVGVFLDCQQPSGGGSHPAPGGHGRPGDLRRTGV